MLTVYLCDDNKTILDKYNRMLSDIAGTHGLSVNIQTFTSGEQLLFHVEDMDARPDIIYLDILMGGDNGLKVARRLRDMGCLAEIIFLTANPEYVFDSFDSAPAHYILKDKTTAERFCEIFFKTAIKAEAKSKAVFYCENGSVKKQIPIAQISYFEVQNRTVTVHYKNFSFDFYAHMEDIQEKLNTKTFVRVHRSFLVHLQYIEQMNKNSLLLSTGETIPVGITYIKSVRTALSHYLNLLE